MKEEQVKKNTMLVMLETLKKVASDLKKELENLEEFRAVISGVACMDFVKAYEYFDVKFVIYGSGRNNLWLKVNLIDCDMIDFTIGSPLNDLKDVDEVKKSIVKDFLALHDCSYDEY
ncbi:hypothetical protein HMPREF1430_00997 [Helicobacter pylori GAM96Ai]|uniref:hypothetical protein n=1 Tax=Helicobacter pylori TaxID=210 RepID=UPI0002B9F776|nr:hypothetical protein [Helicobacter pylori]EMH42074.1 hypothetical protein HMPREF1430_00997 [Helicobacter pylori GAM96Ai]